MCDIAVRTIVEQRFINRLVSGLLLRRDLPENLVSIYLKPEKIIFLIRPKGVIRMVPKEKIMLGFLIKELKVKGRTVNAVLKSSSKLLNIIMKAAAPMLARMLPGFEYSISERNILNTRAELPEGIPEISFLDLALMEQKMQIMTDLKVSNEILAKVLDRVVAAETVEN